MELSKRMRVLEVNNTDIIGRIFNGYDLHLGLIDRNVDAKQVVLEKQSEVSTVLQLNVDEIIRQEISYVEKQLAVSNILFPYAEHLMKLREFKTADIVHYHFPYHQMFSILDYPKLMKENCVWTIHDPWILTGNCVHPLECEKWKDECKECHNLDDDYFPMLKDNVNFMWNVKKKVLKEINPHIIVASKWMKKQIELSPLTCHFTKIHIIPFGICTGDESKESWINRGDKVTIGFRSETGYVKGCSLLYDALRILKDKSHYKLEAVGNGDVPQDICQMYEVAEHGFVGEREKLMKILDSCDIFVMPSLAESFGLMAIEAMACKCVVICFQGTAVEENINAPECGLAVAYKSAEELAKAIETLHMSRENLLERQEKGYHYVKDRYSFEQYVDRHKRLFEDIVRENKINKIAVI